mgnify:CR=1 FL=1
MNSTWAIVLKLLPYLIQLADVIFSFVPKSGEQKKAFVINTAKLAVSAGKEVSEGGQKETWDAVGQVIDSTVTLLNQTKSWGTPSVSGVTFGSTD